MNTVKVPGKLELSSGSILLDIAWAALEPSEGPERFVASKRGLRNLEKLLRRLQDHPQRRAQLHEVVKFAIRIYRVLGCVNAAAALLSTVAPLYPENQERGSELRTRLEAAAEALSKRRASQACLHDVSSS